MNGTTPPMKLTKTMPSEPGVRICTGYICCVFPIVLEEIYESPRVMYMVVSYKLAKEFCHITFYGDAISRPVPAFCSIRSCDVPLSGLVLCLRQLLLIRILSPSAGVVWRYLALRCGDGDSQCHGSRGDQLGHQSLPWRKVRRKPPGPRFR